MRFVVQSIELTALKLDHEIHIKKIPSFSVVAPLIMVVLGDNDMLHLGFIR